MEYYPLYLLLMFGMFFSIIYFAGRLMIKFDKLFEDNKCPSCESTSIIEHYFDGSIETEGKIHPLRYHYTICNDCNHEFFTNSQTLKNKKILLCTSVAAPERQKPN